MLKAINVGGVLGGEAFLVKINGESILVDSGFAFCADKTVKNIEENLGNSILSHIFLTHSHYDHASGVPYIKERWPDVKIIAAEYAQKIFNKPSAINIIKEMNDKAALERGVASYRPIPSDINADIVVKDGDIIEIGNVSFEAIHVPGHTRCSIAFFSKELNLLIGSETFGTPGDDFKYITPCHLVGHQMTIDSIKKGASFNADNLLIPHYGLVAGDVSKKYFAMSLEAVENAKKIVVGAYEKGRNLDEIIQIFKETYYTETLAKAQPEAAFLLNASYLIPMILKECMGVEIK